MIKSGPNAGSSVVAYIFGTRVKGGNLETYKNVINESAIYTHGCNEPKTMKFKWYLSEDETCATLFEMLEGSDGAKLRGENILASPLIGPFQELLK